MISSDLYIFPLPSISACHGQVVVHVGAPFVWAVIWSRPKYSAGVSLTKQQRVYQAVEHHPVNGFKWNFTRSDSCQEFHNVRDKKGIRFNSSMCQMCINVTKQKKIQFTLTGPVCRLRNCRKSVQTPAEMSEIRCKCHSSVPFLCLCWGILFVLVISWLWFLFVIPSSSVYSSTIGSLLDLIHATFPRAFQPLQYSGAPSRTTAFLPVKVENVVYLALTVRPKRLVHS